MDSAWLSAARGMVSRAYLEQGEQALRRRRNMVTSLLAQRRLPDDGWDDASIEMLLQNLSGMDSNNFLGSAGMGEREARCASELVRRRHYGMAHGIGRSGNIADEQPKAAGSTLAARICSFLVLDALRQAGLLEIRDVSVLPVATGMALTLCLLALDQRADAQRKQREAEETAGSRSSTDPIALAPSSAERVVLWPRIDQKTCLKCIQAARLKVVVVEGQIHGDEICTDLAALEREMKSRAPQSIACVLSTTSCFAPRAPDSVCDIARLCAKYGVPHVINNAYGVQSRAICNAITAACRRGRVDVVVQSTDKNFLVPIGGAVIASPAKQWDPEHPTLVQSVNAGYPGRASISPLLDVLITLLSLGKKGWLRLLDEQEDLYQYTAAQLQALAQDHGERLLSTKSNPISLAMSLSSFESNHEGGAQCRKEESWGVDSHHSREPTALQLEAEGLELTFLGSMLFSRLVSGCRVIPRGESKTVAQVSLQGFGSSHSRYPLPYLTAAAALGGTKVEVDTFISRLKKCLNEFRARSRQTC